YLTHRLESAGYRGPTLFSDKCIKLMAGASEGLTRRINIIADKSLLAAYSDNTHTVTPDHVRAAIRDSDFSIPIEWGKRLAVGAATIAVAVAIGFGLSKSGWIKSSPEVALNPTGATSLTAEAKSVLPKTAEIEPETTLGSEQFLGSPQWHQNNINKNNKLTTYSEPETAQATNVEKSPIGSLNTLTSLNSDENTSKSFKTENKTEKAEPKKGFDLETKTDTTNIASVVAPASLPGEAIPFKNPVTAVNSAQNQVLDAYVAGDPLKDPHPSSPKDHTPPTKTLQTRIAASKAWLKSQPDGQCLIQLLMANINNHDNVEYFINMSERQVGPQKIFVFPSEINGQNKYTVIYGGFSDGAKCDATLQKLPTPLKQARPYIRTAGLLRNEAKFKD
ncbi:MAG: hypothetical protein WCE88_10255, partial [Burkholderiales bacterium]